MLDLGYHVFGLIRGHDNPKAAAVRAICPEIRLIRGDVLDQVSLIRALQEAEPDEVYNLAAVSAVPISWEQAELVSQINGLGVWRLLEAIRICGFKECRFWQASSAEVFGDIDRCPQNEETPFRPRNPYGIAKTYAHLVVRNYREQKGMYAVNGILYPHESTRRSEEFVTRKLTRAAAKIRLGLQPSVAIGNPDAVRDWGYAPDYVRAYHLMLRQEEPEDLVIGSGEVHSIRELLEIAFGRVGLRWEEHVVQDPRFWRPPERFPFRSDPSRAEARLEWKRTRSFREMIEEMTDYDLAELSETSAAVPPRPCGDGGGE